MINKNEKILLGIFFLLLVFFRWYPLSLPSWYEKELVQVNISENLAHSHFNIFKTKIDFNLAFFNPDQDLPIVWTEDFPLFPFLAAVGIWFFPSHPLMVGRILSFLFFLLAAFYLFYFVHKRYSQRTAYWSLFFWAVSPLSLAHSTYFIGDVAMVASFLGALAHLYIYFKEKKNIHYVCALLWGMALCTVRYYGALLLFFPLAAYWFSESKERGYRFFIFFLLPPFIEGMWLFYSLLNFQHPLKAMGHWGNWKHYLLESTEYYERMFLRLSKYNITFLGGIFLIIGFIKHRKDGFLMAFSMMVIVSFAFFTQGHDIHPYYQFPWVPLLVILTALGISEVLPFFKKFSFSISCALVLTVCILSFRQAYKLMRYDSGPQILGEKIKSLTPAKATLLLIQDVPDPGVFVYGKRSGRLVGPEFLQDPKAQRLYKKSDVIVIRLSQNTLLKNNSAFLTQLSILKQKSLTLWEEKAAIGRQDKCGVLQFFCNQCSREIYYLALLKLRFEHAPLNAQVFPEKARYF